MRCSERWDASSIQHGSVQVPNDVVAAIERSFNKEEISRPFAELESEYFQKKYFKEELNMMVYSSIVIDDGLPLGW